VFVSVPVVSIPALEIVTAPQDMRPHIPPANANMLHHRQGADTLRAMHHLNSLASMWAAFF
ncbi:hypothetical protein HETIRDRAFT_408708, partial [Heterobasidion irregulare TC 32-1]